MIVESKDSNSLNLGLPILPEIDDEDFIYFIKKVHDTQLTDRMMNELDVRESTKNYYKDLFTKVRHFISKEKERFKQKREETFFNDKPMFNIKDIHNYVIILGTPFVEKVKQDKFKQYLTTKSVLTEFSAMVKEIFFPYEDKDKPTLEKGAMVIVQFSSIEEARLVKTAIDGKHVMKNNIGTALLFDEYLQLSSDKSLENQIDKAHLWENETLEELYIKRNSSSFQQYSFHYLKKQTESVDTPFPVKNTYQLEWSPSGTFLVQNTGSSIQFFSGNKQLEKVIELPENCQKFTISDNERFLVSFLGLGNTNLITDSDYIKDIITRQNVFIWDIFNKEIIKSIKISNDEDFSNFKFSHDSNYMGRIKNETLMIYESPDFKMLLDSTLNKRHALTDKVTKYDWFPNRNYLMTIHEIRKHKNLDSTLEFYEIPSRRKCNLSIPFTNVQVIDHKWHPNGKVLLLLLKTVNIPEWSIRIIEFNFSNFTHKSKPYDILKPVVARAKKDEPMTEKDIDYNSVEVNWMDNGDEILVAAKKRLLIPLYSITEKKYLMSDNGNSVSIMMYSFGSKDLKATPWGDDRNKKNLKYDSITFSPSGKNFIVYNKRFEDRDVYGEGLLYSIDGGQIHNITRLSFGDKLSNIKFDQSGRFFASEMSRVYMGNYVSGGFKIYYISGELISEVKDETLKEILWRPRHLPVCDLYDELSNLKSNDWDEVNKKLEEEDVEFLSDFEKEKRRIYEAGKKKIYSVIEKRRKQWDESKQERSKISKEIETSVVEYEIFREETLKTEEKSIKIDDI